MALTGLPWEEFPALTWQFTAFVTPLLHFKESFAVSGLKRCLPSLAPELNPGITWWKKRPSSLKVSSDLCRL